MWWYWLSAIFCGLNKRTEYQKDLYALTVADAMSVRHMHTMTSQTQQTVFSLLRRKFRKHTENSFNTSFAGLILLAQYEQEIGIHLYDVPHMAYRPVRILGVPIFRLLFCMMHYFENYVD